MYSRGGVRMYSVAPPRGTAAGVGKSAGQKRDTARWYWLRSAAGGDEL